MRNTDRFLNKRVIIVGFARSGIACANLLYSLGAKVGITDNKDSAQVRENLLQLKSKEINVELGRHTQDFVKGNDLLILSPGVPAEALPVLWAKESGIPVISEIELGWILCPATIIAVTGANGKTTVATLIGKILEKSGRKVSVCGNIGKPFCAEVEKLKEGDFVSLEVSSFQLETIRDFRPKIALILNFTPNHLDRYKNMQEYLEAKKRIFMNQAKGDYLVLNGDDPVLRAMAKEAKSEIVFFSPEDELNPNQAAVLAVGRILEIAKDLILSEFRDFPGIEHRMEFVREINKVKFINDSKATTVDSAIWALKNIKEPVVLISGGKHKGVDYRQLIPFARDKVRQVILIGEAREVMRSAFFDALPLDEAQNLEEAVIKAYNKALPGDAVLLSPMCSSFDMFLNYEERGNVFKQIVHSLSKDKI